MSKPPPRVACKAEKANISHTAVNASNVVRNAANKNQSADSESK